MYVKEYFEVIPGFWVPCIAWHEHRFQIKYRNLTKFDLHIEEVKHEKA